MRTLFAILLLSACCGAQVIPSVTAECATSVDGSVVGVPNPLSPPTLVPLYEFIPLPAGTYFVQEAWTDASGNTTLVGPEVQIQLTGGGGEIQETPPVSGLASTVAGRNIYIGTSSGGETLQGSVAGSAAYVQNVALVAGAAVPSTNTTLCQVIANDAAWPSGTGYEMSVTTPAGATLSGFPKQVQFLGPGNSINLGQGLPLYNGSVKYPTPIQAIPYGHATQSISGGLNLSNYNIFNVGRLGVGTLVPGWGVDAEGSGVQGAINAQNGYLYNGAAPLNHCLVGNGAYYVDSGSFCHSLSNTTTVTETGDTALHTVYTVPIPAGAISATGQIRVTVTTDATATAGSPVVLIKYGGTTISPANVVSSSTSGSTSLVLVGGNLGTTNSQSWDLLELPLLGHPTAYGNCCHQTSAVDSTVLQNLTVTYQGGANSDSITFYRIIVEFL